MAEGTEKIENRLKSMDSDLKARNQTAETILWGVAHKFNPPRELLEDIRKADIVTLELPPGAISYRKTGADKDSLEFWDCILKELEKSNKRFWAVDTNKILRNMRKAIMRRLEAPTEKRVNIFLKSMDDLLGLRENGINQEAVSELAKTIESEFVTFITLFKIPEGLEIPIGTNITEMRKDDWEIKAQVFIARPFQRSVKDVCRHVRTRMEGRLQGDPLAKPIATKFALDYVYAFLMSYEDKTQAYKMLHRLQNFCKSTEKKRVVHIHIGGYGHNKNITTLLGSAPHAGYKITEKTDKRFPTEGLSTIEFFEKIPVRERIGLVLVGKNEVALDTDGAMRAFDSLFAHEDMGRLLAYQKIDLANEIYAKEEGYSEYCQLFRRLLISHLCSKIPAESLAELEKRCAPAQYPVETGPSGVYRTSYRPKEDPIGIFLAYLKKKGFKPEAETLQYIKKGRESRCI